MELRGGDDVPAESLEFNAQSQCPLFTKLPAEIREHIFGYAVTKSHRGTIPYPEDSFWYRPGFRYEDRRLDWALLATCRRIYQETRHLPALQREVVLWRSRGPIRSTPQKMPDPAIRRLRIFTQQFWLESPQWRFEAQRWSRSLTDLQTLIITLRHSDWWFWERHEPLGIDPERSARARPMIKRDKTRIPNGDDLLDFNANRIKWRDGISCFENLQRFELELETREGKRGELDTIVKEAEDWLLPMPGKRSIMKMNPAKTRRNGWIGKKLSKHNPSLSLVVPLCPFYAMIRSSHSLTNVNS